MAPGSFARPADQRQIRAAPDPPLGQDAGVIGDAIALPPPGAGRALLEWSLDPIAVAACVLAGALYLAGMRCVRAEGRRIPRSRPVAFLAGLAVLLIALVSPLDVYGQVRFSVHMGQHLLLAYVVPPLLALGAPITLALAAARPGTRRRLLLPALRSRSVAVLSMPLVGWSLFVVSGFAIHFSGLFEAALVTPWVHTMEHGLFLGIGLIYWWPIVGVDPSPHRLSHPARLLSLTMAMVVSGFVAVAIYSADRPLYAWYAALPDPWGPGALADQRWAAALMWVVGSLILIVAGLLVAAAWKRADDERQRRIDAALDRAGSC
jgi:cytochrome c oxidase assembly factor CtaG